MSGSIPTSWIFKETLNHKDQETFQDEDLEKTLVWTAFPKRFGLYDLLMLMMHLGNSAQYSVSNIN